MEKWAIFAKAMLLSCLIYGFVTRGSYDAGIFVLCLLMYVALNMAFYIVKPQMVKRLFAAVIYAAVTAAALFINREFDILLPAVLLDLLGGARMGRAALCALSLLPLLPFRGNAAQYLAADVFALSLGLLAGFSYGRIAAQSKTIDELKAKNYQLYQTLDRNREFDEQLHYAAALDERNKIAQELHDKIGHTISSGIIQLEAAQVVLRNDEEKAREMIGTVTANLSRGMDDIRATLKNIKPPSEMLGFNRVRLLASEFERNSGIRTISVCQGDLNRVTLSQWKIMLDNINEGLTNALRYSHATKVNITVSVLSRLVKCEVRDNGRGAAEIVKGLGLAGMEERAQSAGGQLIFDGSDGFTVITIIPIQ